MHDLERLTRDNAGVVTLNQLRAHGIAQRGGLTSIRRGWYRTVNADPQVLQAVKAGGALSCVSVLRRQGVWVLNPVHDVHVRYAGHRRRPGRHCQPFRSNPPITSSMDPIDIAIRCAANCLDIEDLIVVFDSMLNQRMLELADVRTIAAESRYAHENLAERCDRRAQSGLETLVRLRLRALHIKLDIQVRVDGVGFVDLLVGRRLVIETDGEAHHQDFHHDRDRDLRLKELGFDVVRLTSTHVLDDWDATLARLLVLIRRRDHLRGDVQGLSQASDPYMSI